MLEWDWECFWTAARAGYTGQKWESQVLKAHSSRLGDGVRNHAVERPAKLVILLTMTESSFVLIWLTLGFAGVGSEVELDIRIAIY